MTERPAPVVHCLSCDPTGRGRQCARGRCYCGHVECWAADTYVDLAPPTTTTTKAGPSRAAAAWAERDEPSWLDR